MTLEELAQLISDKNGLSDKVRFELVLNVIVEDTVYDILSFEELVDKGEELLDTIVDVYQ